MMGADHIRVPLVQPGTRPELAEVESRILAERGRVSLLYQVLLHSEPIASGWERLLTAVRKQTGVPAHLRELMILRVAVLNGAEFEFEAHVLHAQEAGVGVNKIAATRMVQLDPVFDPVERLVLQLTDHMTRDVVVPEDFVWPAGEEAVSPEAPAGVGVCAWYGAGGEVPPRVRFACLPGLL